MTDQLPDGVLPVIDPTDAPAAVVDHGQTARVRTMGLARRLVAKGNTKTSEAALRRQTVLREAKGTPDHAGAEDWRDDLHSGQRGKAASKLSATGLTHNAGSGFGVGVVEYWCLTPATSARRGHHLGTSTATIWTAAALWSAPRRAPR